MFRPTLSLAAGLALSSAAAAFDASQCRPYSSQGAPYGPFDFSLPATQAKRAIVENFHFTADVRNLRAGATSSILGDLNYTLAVFPNHYEALMVLSRYWRSPAYKADSMWQRRKYEAAACYYVRGLQFAPHDFRARLLYAVHLHKDGDFTEALVQYQTVLKAAPKYSEAHYNLGLLYVDKKDYKNAKAHAQAAYGANYPLPGLRNRLKAAGAW
ncbi:MAG: tetratricopeptide repeat protein [Gammaproteobacteria bacterium]|nr:tetratricopeptide repeat protein [Gammaproteobacteria bacterium]